MALKLVLAYADNVFYIAESIEDLKMLSYNLKMESGKVCLMISDSKIILNNEEESKMKTPSRRSK